MDYKPTLKTFGQRLRYLRRQRDLTQQALSDKLPISISAIQQYETGLSHPRYVVLVEIARALDVPIEALVGDD